MADLSPEAVIDQRYKILDRIGSGGMADVYVAEDLQLGRKVALKLLHRRFAADQEFVERFRREASSAAGLQHPNVVGVYDRGAWDGTFYIAMEFLPGRSLKQVVREEAPLAPVRAIDLTLQILQAARFAHRRGIVHRDLKPHNAIVDDEDRVKVTDFGIARAGASDMTETGSIMGTAAYLSPEQAQGHAVSPSSDLYSIGVVLYELLTGRTPFEADSAVSIALKHVAEAPAAPSVFNAAVPPELEAIVLWALEKDPARRPADADAFIAALQEVRDRILSGEVGQSTAVFGAPVAEPLPLEEPVPFEQDPVAAGRRRWWLWALLALLVAGGVVAAILLTRPAQVTVPNVVGQDQTAATTILQNKGFQVSVIRQTSTKPRDQVVRESPVPGDKVKKGATISLTVSGGPGIVVVPPVAGLSTAAAEGRLKQAGLKYDVRSETSSTVPAGDATRTDPDSGAQLDRGSRVDLYISSGTAKVTVPDVTGQDEGSARSLLEGKGFTVKVTQAVSGQTPGTVIAQDPAGNSMASQGATVTLTVAKPSDNATVPDVKGKQAADAASALTGQGFKVNQTSKDVKRPEQDGVVLSQDPAGGSTVKKGSSVTIVVGKFNPKLSPDHTGSGSTGSGGSTGPSSTGR